MTRVLIVAPHPDDETLGCGGTLLKHIHSGHDVHWLIVTALTEKSGYSNERIQQRRKEIETVAKQYGMSSFRCLNYPTTQLDTFPMSELVVSIGQVFKDLAPNRVYLPFPGDVHTDHRYVFDAALACTKWFRYPSVSSVLAYETLSETEFGISPQGPVFSPNYFVDISDHLEGKLEILGHYPSELGLFPFPRSREAVRAQAALRGATIGCDAAEAFMILREVWK